MTNEEAIKQLVWFFECDNGLFADKKTIEAYQTLKNIQIADGDRAVSLNAVLRALKIYEYEEFYSVLKRVFMQLPPVTPQQQWIPVSERLPNKDEYIASNGLFIVSDDNRSYTEYFDMYNSQKYFGEPTMEGFKIDRCVTKWMPLPTS